MIKKIILFVFILFVFQVNAQNINKKIEKLLALDGTINNIEQLINQTIEFQKQNNFGIPDTYWEVLEQKISKKSLAELKSIITPIYTKNYTEDEIDSLIDFFGSETGKLIRDKQPIILEQLNLSLMQWSQNLNSYVIEEIENRGKNESSSEEIKKFETKFKAKHGLQILNLNDLAIDQENNIGSLLVDFGKVDGKNDITKIIRIKNNSNKEITFDTPTFLIDDDLKFDWGNKPIEVGETRDLKIILNSEQAESKVYRSFNISPSEGSNIHIGVKYNTPQKELNYKISKNKLPFLKLKQDLSDPYIFVLENTGKKEFHISDIEMDKPIAYLNYNSETLKTNQKTEIRIVISKELMEKQHIKDFILNLKVDLTKGEENNISSFPNKTIKLKIE